jgi:uncharacterized protein
MKILAAGDLHGDMNAAKKLAEKAKTEKVDLVVLSGDLTYGEISTKGLIGPFKKAKKQVLIIPGNHESPATTSALAEIYGVVDLHGYSIKVKDVGIFGAGSANIGIFQLDEGEIFDMLNKSFKKIKTAKKKIMITHCHPDKTLMAKMGPDVVPGSSGVAKAIRKLKPDIAICSHVHEAEGIEEKIGKTRLINVGKKGKIIEI